MHIDGEVDDWRPLMSRASRSAEAEMERHSVPDWVEEVQRQRFRWDGHVARREEARSTTEMLMWRVHGSHRKIWKVCLVQFFEHMFSEGAGPRNFGGVAAVRD